MSRIKLGYTREEKTPPNIYSDFEWLHYHKDALVDEYGERFVVIYQEQVLGVGDTYEAAVENAERNLPPSSEQITPIVILLGRRHPFLRVRPSNPTD